MKTIAVCLLSLYALPAAAQTVETKYDKGFVVATTDGKFELKTGIRSQLRLESRKVIDGGEFTSAFMLPRVRLQFEGFAYGKDNAYKLEFEAANKGFSVLKDFYVDHAFSEQLHLRVGQWKKPINRQEMVSDFSSDFLERSITNEFIGGGRDQGVALHNNYDKSPEGVEWAVGVFNAGSDKPSFTAAIDCTDPMDATTCTVTPKQPTTVPADFGPMLVGRVGFNKGGIKGYSDADLEGGPLRFAVAASYKVNLGDLDEDAQQHAAVADAMVKVNGISVLAAGFVRKDGPADVLVGALLQPGYVIARQYEVAGRFAFHDEGDARRVEMLAGFTRFFEGHNYKWNSDAGVVHVTGVKDAQLQIRTQLQLVF
ncbi:MAG TPA: porin [Kofleriaceae bacterium]|nr:porin [Kofleriaceae bacterium]